VAASPLGFWWLPPATVYACGLLLIASVYIGFSVADGRPKIIAVEVAAATAFVVRAPRVPRGLLRQPVQRQVRFEDIVTMWASHSSSRSPPRPVILATAVQTC
jgi:hypothetical protein